MQLDRIVGSWHRLALHCEIEEGDDFFRFIAAWVSFNALYALRYADRHDAATETPR
jgi:hypothetical protein